MECSGESELNASQQVVVEPFEYIEPLFQLPLVIYSGNSRQAIRQWCGIAPSID